ncbi:IS1595 family transposase [Comamonas odontotermitis]|uniref:IS1595 family transposase n=1 Tax=Comamonas odontotermitis TaxID=379895 RepID=UPI00366A5E10
MDKNEGKQHILLSAKVRDFTLWDAANLTEEEAFWKFVELRWGSEDQVTCPSCGAIAKPYARANRGQLRCRHCDHHFSPFVASPFADRKMDFKKLLMAICLYTASAKGVPALFMCRLLDMQDKTATVLTGKLRESLIQEMDTEILSGVVEIDGGYFCGKPRKGRLRLKTRPEDVAAALEAKLKGEPRAKRKPRSKAEARNWARRSLRRVVMVLRQVDPQTGKGANRTRVAIAYSENERVATRLARILVEPGSTIMTDENAAYNVLSSWYDHHCVEHSVEFSTVDGVNENQAESYFSRLRRAEYGTYHGFRPKYLMDYAQEFAWREDVRKKTEKEKIQDLMARVFSTGHSHWWRGYWQGHHREDEFPVQR